MDQETYVRKFGVDIVAVIDKSGSMEDGKLRLVKETLHFMISELQAQDRLCLVTFSTKVFTDMPLTFMDAKGKAVAEDVVSAIVADGTTNLSGGLYEGLRNLQKDENNVNDVSIGVGREIWIETVGMSSVFQFSSSIVCFAYVLVQSSFLFFIFNPASTLCVGNSSSSNLRFSYASADLNPHALY